MITGSIAGLCYRYPDQVGFCAGEGVTGQLHQLRRDCLCALVADFPERLDGFNLSVALFVAGAGPLVMLKTIKCAVKVLWI